MYIFIYIYIFKSMWCQNTSQWIPAGSDVQDNIAWAPVSSSPAALNPGVHQEECGQQDEGGSPSPLHCPGEASSGVLCPVVGSPVQER